MSQISKTFGVDRTTVEVFEVKLIEELKNLHAASLAP